MTLQNLLAINKLQLHQASRGAVLKLLRAAQRIWPMQVCMR